jgi:hypothetical protein
MWYVVCGMWRAAHLHYTTLCLYVLSEYLEYGIPGFFCFQRCKSGWYFLHHLSPKLCHNSIRHIYVITLYPNIIYILSEYGRKRLFCFQCCKPARHPAHHLNLELGNSIRRPS